MGRCFSDRVRKAVITRANSQCEYCLVFERHSFFPFHIDHIISRKHGGLGKTENLAYACPVCNQHKGSDIGTIDYETNEISRFFNPRVDVWSHHFQLADSGIIQPLTKIGRATVAILQVNSAEATLQRKILKAGKKL
jgi:hypothetical protein